MYNSAMETVEYMWVNMWCMVDWIIGFCHKAAEKHFLDIVIQPVSAQNETLLCLVGMNCVKIRNHCNS